MHLYEINPDDRLPVHVVARTLHEAVDLVVTWSAARGRNYERITVNRLSVYNLKPEQLAQVHSAFAAGLVGIWHFDEEIGWTFSPPLWMPLDNEEQTGADGKGAST